MTATSKQPIQQQINNLWYDLALDCR